MLIQQFADRTAASAPLDCQDWANTQAAYRFLANERVSLEDALASLQRPAGTGTPLAAESFATFMEARYRRSR